MISLPNGLEKRTTILENIVRYVDIPAKVATKNDTAVIFIAGQKSPLERFFPLAEYFSQFYHTYGYEIPGMGIIKRNPETPPTISAISKEVGEFILKKVSEKNVIVVAASAGFWFTTQALLDEPQLQKRVVKIISIVGMLGKDTFGFSAIKKAFILFVCKINSTKLADKVITWLLKRDRLINTYSKYLIRRRHLGHLPSDIQQEYEDFEKFLLKTGDWKIHFSTVSQYLSTPTPTTKKLNIPILALYSATDQFFPLERQRQVFERVYSQIEWDTIKLKGHAPLVVKDYREYQDVVPEERIKEFLIS